MVFVNKGEASFSALGVEAALDLSGSFLLRARVSAADQHTSLFDYIEIIALKSAGCHDIIN